jgi:hypothetical protein
MSDATFPCPVCGVTLPARAKFCADCGSAVRGAPAPGKTPPAGAAGAAAGNPILPWFIAGVSVIAIQTLALILALRPAAGAAGLGAEPQASAGPTAPFAPLGTNRGTTDLSGMTPRQAADRLFDRVARASEAGDTAQVQFFAPMTVQAYAGIPMDADVRLHLGMIEMAMGKLDAAAAQADSLVRESRTHLFGPMLKARVAEARRDPNAAKAAWRTFLANYDAERAKRLPEYDQHESALTEARTAAQRAAPGR